MKITTATEKFVSIARNLCVFFFSKTFPINQIHNDYYYGIIMCRNPFQCPYKKDILLNFGVVKEESAEKRLSHLIDTINLKISHIHSNINRLQTDAVTKSTTKYSVQCTGSTETNDIFHVYGMYRLTKYVRMPPNCDRWFY